VRDFQILRLVLVEHLEKALARSLTPHEQMAVGVALDDAIAASVNVYTRQREEAIRQMENERAERTRQIDEAAQQRAQDLQEVNRRKDEFLAMFGHELRNMLGPVRNALHILHLRQDDRSLVEWARDLMERQVQHLSRIMDDLLDVSRISRGRIILRRERVELVRLVREAAEDWRGTMSEADLTLTLDLPSEAIWIQGDSTRLAQVVGNLLQNARKFTGRGGQVNVRVAREQDGPWALVSVRDTGIGIEPSLLPRIFDTFMQGDRGLEQSRGGLGLGLALVRGLAVLHGGEVRARSEGIGQGAEFTLRLPTETALAEAIVTPKEPPSVERSLRILIIEDNRDSAESLKILLELHSHQVAIAATGAAGVEQARTWKPDVVLCDIGLPGMNGYDVAAELRHDSATAGAYLIAVSGHGSEPDQQRCLQAGFDRHMTKPVDPTALQQVLASWSMKTN
jgi:signal transduction histidine kinase